MAVATPSRCPSPPSERSTANAAAAVAIVLALALASSGCGGMTASDPTAPGPRTIDFSPLLATGPKLGALDRLAVAIDPGQKEQVMTLGASGGSAPAMLVLPTNGACSQDARRSDDVGRLASYGAARVDSVELELRAEGDDGMPTPANTPSVCVAVRDAGGAWHWLAPRLAFDYEAGPPRTFRRSFALADVGPITAVSFVANSTLDPRSIVKISYHVVGP